MSRFHVEFLWLAQTHLITKELMRAITSLSDFDDIPTSKLARNKDVMELTGATPNGYSLSISSIENIMVKYLAMMIGIKSTSPTEIIPF